MLLRNSIRKNEKQSSQELFNTILIERVHLKSISMLGFSWFVSHSDFFKINFFTKLLQEHYQSVKRFGSRPGPTFCRSRSGSKLSAKVISSPLQSTFSKKKSGTLSYPGYHSVKRFGSRSEQTVGSVLTWVQTICKGYQRTSKLPLTIARKELNQNSYKWIIPCVLFWFKEILVVRLFFLLTNSFIEITQIWHLSHSLKQYLMIILIIYTFSWFYVCSMTKGSMIVSLRGYQCQQWVG